MSAARLDVNSGLAGKLRRLLTKLGPNFTAMLEGLIGSGGAILDAAGSPIIGDIAATNAESTRSPLTVDGQTVGYVQSAEPRSASMILQALVDADAASRVLANDALDRRRQLNLLYSLSATLTLAAGVSETATVAISEATRLIPSDCAVVLIGANQAELKPAAVVGDDPDWYRSLLGPIGTMGSSDIVEDLNTDPRFGGEQPSSSVVFVAFESVSLRGYLILLRNRSPYRSGDLKQLAAVGSQAGPALAAELTAQLEREAAERQANALRQQISELKIELDQSRQRAMVDEITSTDYFHSLRARAGSLREIIDDEGGR